jgi:hypothetical protein
MKKVFITTEDGVEVWRREIELSTPVPTPVPTPTPVPLPGNCSTNYLGGIGRANVGVAAGNSMCWFFDIPANTKMLTVEAIGGSLTTDAVLVWTFPSGRVFEGKLLGPGTKSVKWKMKSKAISMPNLPDDFIPIGRHKMTITGLMSGTMSVVYGM